MQDPELQILQDNYGAFFTPIRAKSKSPYIQGWQNHPFTLDEIESPNIGLMLGDNLLAIDLDGQEAFDYFLHLFPNGLTGEQISWTSNKTPYNLQYLVTIPKEYQEFIHTIKVSPNKKLEFRYRGCQSVMPPSIHPDTNKPYEWIERPSWVENLDIIIQDNVLTWLLNECNKDQDNTNIKYKEYATTNSNVLEIVEALHKIKCRKPILNYSDWCSISWATMAGLGIDNAIPVLNQLWPERPGGKSSYQILARSFNPNRISAGYLINESRK